MDTEIIEMGKLFATLAAYVACGNFYDVDKRLEQMGPIADAYGPAFLIGVLSITQRCKAHLRNRDSFINYVEASLVERIGAERFDRLIKDIR